MPQRSVLVALVALALTGGVFIARNLAATELTSLEQRLQQGFVQRPDIIQQTSSSLVDTFQGASVEDILHLGQQFVYGQIAKAMLELEYQKVPWVKVAPRKNYSQKATVDLLSLQLSEKELKGGKMNPGTTLKGIRQMHAFGGVVLQGIVPQKLCADIYRHTLVETKRVMAAEAAGKISSDDSEFGSIQANELRKDLPLKLNNESIAIFRHTLRLVQDIIVEKLGPEPKLVEFSSLLSFPGAGNQEMHPDAGMDDIDDSNDADVISAFVYLVNVSENMAALEFLPRTHTYYHFIDEHEMGNLQDTIVPIRMTVPVGTVILMDSRTHHRGTANTSPRNRPVFYFSFMAANEDPPDGPTYSLRKEYEGLTLTTLMTKIDSHFTPHENIEIQTERQNIPLELTTMNFNSMIKISRFSFVAFYDPRSASYNILNSQFMTLANKMQNVSDLTFCKLDGARHSYLADQIAPMFSESDQAVRDDDDIFVFGSPNYFPYILVLFEYGMNPVEYTGVVESESMRQFLYRRFESSARKDLIEDEISEDKLKKILDSDDFVMLGCFKTETLYNSNGSDTEGRELVASFRNASNELSGWVTSREVQANHVPALYCRKPVQLFYQGEFLDAWNIDTWFAHEQMVDSIVHWVEASMRSSYVWELTPDNSHRFLDMPEPLLVLLTHPDEEDENNVVKQALLAASKHVKAESKTLVQLSWANGPEFASQFRVGSSQKDLPRIVFVNTLAETEEVSYHAMKRKKGFSVNAILKEAQRLGLLTSYKKAQANARMRLERKNRAKTETSDSNINITDNSEDSDDEPDEDLLETATSIDSNSTTSEIATSISAHLVVLHEYMDYQYKGYANASGAKEIVEKGLMILKKVKSTLPELNLITVSAKKIEEMLRGNKTGLINLVKEKIKQLHYFGQSTGAVKLKSKALRLHQYITHSMKDIVKSLEADFRKNVPIEAEVVVAGDRSDFHSSSRKIEKIAIDRFDYKDLSMEKFYYDYAKKKRPVIIENFPMTKRPWSLDYIDELCGDRLVDLVKRSTETSSWGGLVDAEELELSEFIETYTTNTSRSSYYLHDWGLPSHCPKLFGDPPYDEFSMPKYFAGDYFQRVFPNNYQHSWPSLFIGAKGTQSDLHVDSGGTNFWMYLMSGEKEWRFFPREDIVNLYPRWGTAKFEVDAFNPDFKKYPLFEKANMFYTIQKPGDLVFIPGGNPHAVRNNDHIHSMSMNYVDASNYYLHLWTILNDEDWRGFELMSNGDFPEGLDSSQQDLTWGEFKSTNWSAKTFDIF